MSFVHLHTHTHYTFQQALGDPIRLAARAKELGQNALAITDAGNMYGAFEFYEACQNEGIKPIIGVEFQISKKGRKNREKNNELYEIVCLAKNKAGYCELIQLVTLSQMEGYYNGIPRIDFPLLEAHAKNLIALSGSMYGEIGQAIITGKKESYICERIAYYQRIFGEENFFLELQEHPDRAVQPKINEMICTLAKKYNYQYVGTNNSYYINLEDAESQDMMTAVSSGRALDDPDRATLMNGDYSLRSSRDMEELFVYAPRAYENTQKIADMIDLVIEYGDYKIPVFPLSQEEQEKYTTYTKDIEVLQKKNPTQSAHVCSSEEWLLRMICIEGLNTRYNFGLQEKEKNIILQKIATEKITKKISDISVDELHHEVEKSYSEEKKTLIASFDEEKQAIIERLEYELLVVHLMGFTGYFCIVADFIRYGKNNNIPVGPGRGSAAGAILAYLSDITDIDPVKYNLLFERFLNPARISMPDIDVDFSDKGRDKIIAYVRKKYGADRVAQVCTFGTLAARAAVKDAGRALGIPFSEMNEFAKLIPGKPGITLEKALQESPDLKKAYEQEEKYKKVIDAAKRFEGAVRQLGVHACAVIIAPEPITHFCPIQPPPKDPNTTVTQFSAHPLEDLGLLKMDFLGLRNLTILDRAVRIVERVSGKKIDLLNIDYEDPKVMALFSEGDMTGVFQFESSGMRRYLKELKPSKFEDLIAMVSLYRPGPIQYIPDFIARKQGKKVVKYPHPSLEKILEPTYGIAVYQEQIMQIVQAFAGFSLGEADILRRAIGKKIYDLLMEQREKFIQAAKEQGHSESLAIYIFDEIIEPFAGYGFNKSHAACYAMIAYQTAFIKTYYPTEAMVALMVSDEEDIDRIRMEIEEARSKGVNILPPDVNESLKHFTFIDAKNIRFGLKAIKGLGDGPIATISASLQDGKFVSIEDFIERTGGDVINRKSLESLILSGALDRFAERASLLASMSKMISYLKEVEHKKETSQIGLFDTFERDTSSSRQGAFELEKAPPMTFEERIKGERAMIGYPVSGHPLDGIEDFIIKKSKNSSHIVAWKKRQQKASLDILLPEEDVSLAPPPFSSLDELPSEEPSPAFEGVPRESGEIQKETTAGKKTKKKEVIFAKLIGLISDVRDFVTKSGGHMLIVTVESVGFDFRIIIFPRDYVFFVDKLEVDHMVVAEGRLQFNDERNEVSLILSANTQGGESRLSPNTLQVFTITQFHMFAEKTESKKLPKQNESPSSPEPYCIQVPPFWSREDLLELKEFLAQQTPGRIPIIIRVKGAEKKTKFSIETTKNLEHWITEHS